MACLKCCRSNELIARKRSLGGPPSRLSHTLLGTQLVGNGCRRWGGRLGPCESTHQGQEQHNRNDARERRETVDWKTANEPMHSKERAPRAILIVFLND